MFKMIFFKHGAIIKDTKNINLQLERTLEYPFMYAIKRVIRLFIYRL